MVIVPKISEFDSDPQDGLIRAARDNLWKIFRSNGIANTHRLCQNSGATYDRLALFMHPSSPDRATLIADDINEVKKSLVDFIWSNPDFKHNAAALTNLETLAAALKSQLPAEEKIATSNLVGPDSALDPQKLDQQEIETRIKTARGNLWKNFQSNKITGLHRLCQSTGATYDRLALFMGSPQADRAPLAADPLSVANIDEVRKNIAEFVRTSPDYTDNATALANLKQLAAALKDKLQLVTNGTWIAPPVPLEEPVIDDPKQTGTVKSESPDESVPPKTRPGETARAAPLADESRAAALEADRLAVRKVLETHGGSIDEFAMANAIPRYLLRRYLGISLRADGVVNPLTFEEIQQVNDGIVRALEGKTSTADGLNGQLARINTALMQALPGEAPGATPFIEKLRRPSSKKIEDARLAIGMLCDQVRISIAALAAAVSPDNPQEIIALLTPGKPMPHLTPEQFAAHARTIRQELGQLAAEEGVLLTEALGELKKHLPRSKAAGAGRGESPAGGDDLAEMLKGLKIDPASGQGRTV